jgi:hypothetical protein
LGNEWEWGRVLGREHLLGWGVVLQECTWRWARVQQGGGGNLLSLRESLVEALVWGTGAGGGHLPVWVLVGWGCVFDGEGEGVGQICVHHRE